VRRGRETPPTSAQLGGTYRGEGRAKGDLASAILAPSPKEALWRNEEGRIQEAFRDSARAMLRRWPQVPDADTGRAIDPVGGNAASGSDLPCLYSHNCTELTPKPPPWQASTPPKSSAVFPPSARRTAFSLQLNVQAMCDQVGIEKVGFLTLTFSDHILEPKEAQRRMHSLTTHVLRPRYGRVIRVIERQKSGRIHYHLLVSLPSDIRTGADFDAFALGEYRSANKALRDEWAFWRKTAKLYGFGRTELLPIKSSKEAIGRYVGKYIAKHIDQRQPRDKGVRLVSYSGHKVANTYFSWAGGLSKEWRKKLKAFVYMLHDQGAIASPTIFAMRSQFGSKWAMYWRDSIIAMPVD
jgi:hypothetical protein